MMCRHPFVRDPTGKSFVASLSDPERLIDGVPFPCGQCLPCRINKRRVWTHRMMLESLCYEPFDQAFVTLTYEDEHLPPGGVLVKKHLQDYIKRLRRKVEPVKLRYYACGEYGSLTHRPHYHLIIFGLGSSNLFSDCWHFGHTFVGEVERESIQYVAGYVSKKIAYKFHDLVPEFAVMSRKPGIGFPALEKVADLMEKPQFRQYLGLKGDIPIGLMHASKFLPFGRYLKEKLRVLCHLTVDPDVYFKQIRQEYFRWRSENPDDIRFYVDYEVQKDSNKAKHQELRHKIFSRGVI